MPWPARPGAKGAAPSPARDRLLSRRTVAREEVPAQATTTQGFPASSLFSHQGFLNPWKAESLFPTLKEGSTSLHWMDEHQCPPLPVLWAPGDRALSGRMHSRTPSKDFSVHISQKTNSLSYAGWLFVFRWNRKLECIWSIPYSSSHVGWDNFRWPRVCCFRCGRLCIAPVVSGLERGDCDFSRQQESPSLQAALGVSPMGKSVKKASNLKTQCLAEIL